MKILNLLLILAAAPAMASAPSTQKFKEAFCPFQENKAQALFAPEIFHEASMEDFAGMFAQQTDYYGPCKGVSEKQGEIRIEYRDATLPFRGQFEKGKIRNFYFGRPVFPNDSFEKIAAFAKKTMGKVSILVSKEGAKIFEYEPRPMNVGSNNALFILKALKEKVDRKELSVEKVVKLDEKTKSGSAGFLHFWTPGTAITLDTLKNLMVVERDLTAADMLIQAVGRKEIEKGGATLSPFLTNREYAQIYAAKDGAAIAASPQRLAALSKQKEFIDYPRERYDLVDKAGWFAKNEELCSALFSLKDEKLLFGEFRSATEEEGKDRWSEYSLMPARGWGIAQNSALLRSKGKPQWYCVSVTANSHEAIEEQAIGDVTYRIYSLIHQK